MTRALAVIALALVALAPQEKPKSYRLPPTDLHQRVIWGSTCEVPDGPSLAFGGQDQQAEDGNPHTRIKVDGQWVSIDEELRKQNPVDYGARMAVLLIEQVRRMLVECRRGHFEGWFPPEAQQAVKGYAGANEDIARLRIWIEEGIKLAEKEFADLKGDDLARAKHVLEVTRKVLGMLQDYHDFFIPGDVRRLEELRIHCERIAEFAGAEPPPRALSPIAYDAKSKLFVIFGGDHLDFLTNDTWVFDPTAKRWTKRRPPTAPPPRANHVLKASGDGMIVLSGGYTYTSSTDYVGGQYRDQNDGEWVYDIAADTWTGKGGVAETRVYRTGRLHPDYYMEGPKPDPKAFAEWLTSVPVNTWTLTKPPHLPALNRDWGTAVLDPDRDLILRWSGGHSAHGGTDVLQYHLKTNRWELTMPVEFPLGQLYSNTDYPEGWNFNHRPWITGHTYQNYGYDPNLKMLLFTGKREYCYVWDSSQGDWRMRFKKPKGMTYDSCFYTLTLTPTPQGLVCWTQEGRLFRFDGKDWVEMPLRGAKMPGSVVDNSTIVYDSRRDRLLAVRKGYGDKNQFDGTIAVVEIKSGEVTLLSPAGKEKAAAVPYLCQFRYDPTTDLVLGGCTLEPDADGVRRTPTYDCAGDRWVTLKIGGDDPSGKKGRNVSLGLMVDVKRKLFWAVDTNSNVYVLRLAVASADLQPM
jgi:hypothetical protein